jgi:NADH dehydrogenase
MPRHRVIIVGGGFAGMNAALALRRVPVETTLVDRRNFHLFQPLLYQVATGGLSPADIAHPLRAVLGARTNARVIQTGVEAIDPDARRVVTGVGPLDYDTLIVAAGAGHHYFGNDAWEAHAPGLKTIEDATRMRSRILKAFERAETATDPDERRALLTFVIVGGGPTGVELAGAIGELALHTMKRDFHSIRTEEARVLLVEGLDRILPTYPVRLSAAAERSLRRLRVEVRTGARVKRIDADGVALDTGGRVEALRAATVLWAAGVRASPLARDLAERAGAELDRAGRVVVDERCAVPGRPEILVLGDLALYRDREGNELPGVAPVATQQGRYAGRLIRDRLRGVETAPFRYRDMGNLAVIGRAAAVADLGRLRFSGYPAWLLWLFVHIMYLVGFENRLLVFIQWGFSYFTRHKGARLITE